MFKTFNAHSLDRIAQNELSLFIVALMTLNFPSQRKTNLGDI